MSLLDQIIVADEIQRAVAQAVKDGSLVRPGERAALILEAHPECGLTEAQIVERLTIGVIRAHVSFERARATRTEHKLI